MASPTQSGQDILSLSEFLKIIRNRLGLILLIMALTVATTALVTGLFMDKWYEATATIRVEKPEGQVSLFQQQTASSYDPFFVNAQLDILEGEKTLVPVIERLDLRSRLAEMVGISRPLTEREALDFLKKQMLSLDPLPSTDLIDVSVLAKDPDLAAAIANAVPEEYAQHRIAHATSGQTAAIDKLSEELDAQERTVSDQRDTVEKLRQDLNIAGVDLNTDMAQMEVENLRQMEATLSELKVDAIARKTRWERFRDVPAEQRLNLVNSELIPDPNIQDLMQAYLVADQNYSRLEQRLGEAHPELVAARRNLEVMKAQLNRLLDGYEQSLEIAYSEAQARVEAMQEELKGLRADQIQAASHKMRLFEEAVEKLRDEESLLRAMRIALRQREVDFQAPKTPVEFINTAFAPDRPAKPNWPLNIALALVAGGVLGLAAAYFAEFVDTSFRNVEDIEEKLGMPVLGVVVKGAAAITPQNITAFQAEPYRVVQTNLELARDGQQGNALVFQSAGPGEGKSTTLRNLATVMALSGHRTVIVDTDLRRPSQHHFFEVPRMPGLIDALQGGVTLDEVTRPTSLENLSFIPSGDAASTSLSLLHGRRLEEVVTQLKQQYDRVLLDSPPVVGISDAAVLARLADGVVFIVQHRRNPRKMTLRARQVIEHVDGRILGAVLNQVPESSGEDLDYYTSNYEYYREEDKSDRNGAASGHKPASAPDRIALREKDS